MTDMEEMRSMLIEITRGNDCTLNPIAMPRI